MEKRAFHCTKHAVINVLADVLREKRFYIRDIDDKKGYVLAQQPIRVINAGCKCRIEIIESEPQVVVNVNCVHNLRIDPFGAAKKTENVILDLLSEEL